MFTTTGLNFPTNLTAEQVNSTSIRVSWTPPASEPNITGYQIYYQTFGNWGTVDIDVNETECTITSLKTSYTYNITLVAVFPNATVGHKVIMPGTYLHGCGGITLIISIFGHFWAYHRNFHH